MTPKTATSPSTSAAKKTSRSGSNGASKSAESVSPTTARKRRETTWEKAFRMLLEGKVKVTFVSEGRYLIRATVEGDSGSYVVDHGVSREGRWHCSCPAYSDCSHVRAVQQVTAARGME